MIPTWMDSRQYNLPDNTRPITGDIDICPKRRLWPHFETLTLETTQNLLRSGAWHTLPCFFTILRISTEVQSMVTEWHILNMKVCQTSFVVTVPLLGPHSLLFASVILSHWVNVKATVKYLLKWEHMPRSSY